MKFKGIPSKRCKSNAILNPMLKRLITFATTGRKSWDHLQKLYPFYEE